MDYKFYECMLSNFSEVNAYNNVNEIHSRDKWFSYDKFAESAVWCAEKMRESGLDEVEVNELAADGVTLYGDRKVSPAWCAKSAVLRFPDGEILCDYQAIPCSLSMYSAATPPDGINAEVIVIDDIKNPPPDQELFGKLILTSSPSGAICALAARSGAIGILHDYFPLFPDVRDSRDEMKGAHRWDCLSLRHTDLFAFSLAPEQGDRLREMAKNSKLILHAAVDAGDSQESLYVISGAIIGTEPNLPEIILYAHLDEPGANDNASGCGGLLELGRSMAEAIKGGALRRPRNTIRFVMGPEYEGSMGYIYYHPNRPRLALLAADMIGNEELDRAHMTITLDPLANYSYADAAILLANHRYDLYTGTIHSYDTRVHSAGSDNFVADPSLDTPSVSFINFPAQSYHSSLDTMDRIEPEILKRNACIVGDFAYMLATADLDICNSLEKILKFLYGNLAKDAKTSREATVYKEVYTASLCSLKRLNDKYEPPVLYKESCEEMPEYAKDMGADRIPIRIVKGPLSFASHPEILKTDALKLKYSTPLFWTNGERSIWDITIHSAVENGWDGDDDIRALLEKYIKMFNVLAEFEYINWVK